MLETNKIYNIDCILGMQQIENNSIDLVITSPPYDNIRDYKKDTWTIDLPVIGKEISRILKDGGMCVMVIQDQTKNGRKSLTSFKTIVNWCENTELDLWECCIYYRSGPGAWWNKRFRVDHEYMPIFIKGKRPQYFNKEHMKIPAKQGGVTKSCGGVRRTDGSTIKSNVKTINEKKCCGTVINYESEKNSRKNKIKLEHPATFPDKLASDFIQVFTVEDMIVLDPFMGSGTVARMAKQLNRNYVGFEINATYCDITNKLIQDIV